MKCADGNNTESASGGVHTKGNPHLDAAVVRAPAMTPASKRQEAAVSMGPLAAAGRCQLPLLVDFGARLATLQALQLSSCNGSDALLDDDDKRHTSVDDVDDVGNGSRS